VLQRGPAGKREPKELRGVQGHKAVPEAAAANGAAADAALEEECAAGVAHARPRREGTAVTKGEEKHRALRDGVQQAGAERTEPALLIYFIN